MRSKWSPDFRALALFFILVGCDAKVVSSVSCGDGYKDPGEECDTLDLGSVTCESLGYPWGALSCSDECRIDKSGCEGYGLCGNGVLEAELGEVCDQEILSGQTCISLGYYGGSLACRSDCVYDDSRCQAVGRCGDGAIQTLFEEECDEENLDGLTCTALGYHGGTLTCAEDCRIDVSGCATTGACGDGILQTTAGEECDTEEFGGQSCETLGYYGGTLLCGVDCLLDTLPCQLEGRCGDGIIQGSRGEQCDGTALDGQTCMTRGFSAGVLTCSPDCQFVEEACGNITQLSVGTEHACVTMDTGAAWCWGSNDSGQLGDGTVSTTGWPVRVLGLAGAVQVRAGNTHSCAVLADGTVRCWGNNYAGQLGDGTTLDSPVPVQVSGLSNVRSIHVGTGTYYGSGHTCALKTDGEVHCWGSNHHGKLGDGTSTNRSTPVRVINLLPAISLATGEGFTCAVQNDGVPKCWGCNEEHQLSNESIYPGTSTPVDVRENYTPISGMNLVSSLWFTTCTRRNDGTVECWGNNTYCNCGRGISSFWTTAGPVSGLSGVIALSLGAQHGCALLNDGTARCWGANHGGQVSASYQSDEECVPIAVASTNDLLDIQAGNNFTCVLTQELRVQCWGFNLGGRLGRGNLEDEVFVTPDFVRFP